MYTYIIYVNLCPKDDFISDGYSVRIQDGASYLFVSYNFVPDSLCHHFFSLFRKICSTLQFWEYFCGALWVLNYFMWYIEMLELEGRFIICYVFEKLIYGFWIYTYLLF